MSRVWGACAMKLAPKGMCEHGPLWLTAGSDISHLDAPNITIVIKERTFLRKLLDFRKYGFGRYYGQS
jgi:hypothetical protein